MNSPTITPNPPSKTVPTVKPKSLPARSASSPASAEHLDPFVLKPGESRSLLAGAPWKRFAVLGDSLAEGVGENTPGYFTLSWADRVAAELATPGYINLAHERLTAAEIASTQLDEAIAWQPDLVAVIAGGNDILKGDPDLGVAEVAIESIYRRSRRAGADVIGFTLMDPSPIFGDERLARRIGALNAMIRQTAARSGAAVVDMAIRPFADDRSIYSADLKHPNMRGHAIVASAVVEQLGELIRNRQGVI